MAKEKKHSAVLDCNWLLSAAIKNNSRDKLYLLLIKPRLEIYYSKELIAEYSEVIVKKKFTKYISYHAAHEFIIQVIPKLIEVEITQTVIKSRDPKGNYLYHYFL